IGQALMGSLMRRVTGENLPLMKVNMHGESVTYYANQGQHVVIYKLSMGEIISVESENILAFTQDCKYSVRFIGCGVLSQKGLATSVLTGNGNNAYVAILSDGNPIVLSNVKNRNTISVDPDAVICWVGQGHCDPQVKVDVSWKTFIGQTSGESYAFEWSGGQPVSVVVQPSEREGGISVRMD
ncbi:MAG: AIM24 family protein, partial [Lachnospiraceae bacterium]|nr:AIM24 family protein [Lachnospiraceae bacterium]